MNILLFAIMVLFGLTTIIIAKKKSNKISVYKKINNNDFSQEKNESNISGNKKEIKLSSYIKLPYILYRTIYFKMLIFIILTTSLFTLIAIGIITINASTLLLFGFTIIITTIYLPKIIIKKL